MKKLDLGQLVNDNYTRDEVIEILADELGQVSRALLEAIEAQNWGAVGANATSLVQIAATAKRLHEKVNGKSEGVVV